MLVTVMFHCIKIVNMARSELKVETNGELEAAGSSSVSRLPKMYIYM
jgi:hypothetical protein